MISRSFGPLDTRCSATEPEPLSISRLIFRALINGKPAAVGSRFQEVIDDGAQVNVSTIVVFDLRK